MKNFLRPSFLLLLLLISSERMYGQDFIHDSIAVSYYEKEVTLYYGLTTATEIEALFKDSRSKTKVKTTGTAADKTYTLTKKITLSDGKTHFYCTAFGSERGDLEKQLTLQSIYLKKGSLALINNGAWFLKNRKFLMSDLGAPVKEKKARTYYYPARGVLISYNSRSTLATPKKITFYESPEVADQNFQIYLDWKSKQEE